MLSLHGKSCFLSTFCLLYTTRIVCAYQIFQFRDLTVPKVCYAFLVADVDTIEFHLAFLKSDRPYETMELFFENPETNKSKLICGVNVSTCHGQVSPGCHCSGNKVEFSLTVAVPAKTEFSSNTVIIGGTRYHEKLWTIVRDKSDYSVELQVNKHRLIKLQPNKTCPLLTPSPLGTKTYFKFCMVGLVKPIIYLRFEGRNEISLETDSIGHHCISQDPVFQACVQYVDFRFQDQCQREGAYHCPIGEPYPPITNITIHMTVNLAYPIKIRKDDPCPLITASTNTQKTFLKFCVKGLDKPSLKLSHVFRTVEANNSDCVIMSNVFNSSVKVVTFSYEDICRRKDKYECPVEVPEIIVPPEKKAWVWSQHIYVFLLFLALLMFFVLAVLGAMDFFFGFNLRNLFEETSKPPDANRRESRARKGSTFQQKKTGPFRSLSPRSRQKSPSSRSRGSTTSTLIV